jgi:hypothetical protein
MPGPGRLGDAEHRLSVRRGRLAPRAAKRRTDDAFLKILGGVVLYSLSWIVSGALVAYGLRYTDLVRQTWRATRVLLVRRIRRWDISRLRDERPLAASATAP